MHHLFKDKKFAQYFSIFLGSFVALLVLVFFVIWYNRGEIFKYFAEEYMKDTKEENLLGLNNSSGQSSIFSQESFVIEAVKKANPAVVSIVITKDVPKYESYLEQRKYNPFGNLFPGLDFFYNVPQYRQNGTEKKEIGGGSGFLATENGLIVTNKHVVDQSDVEYTVFTNDGESFDAKVVAKDPVLDIAIIKIEGNNFPYLSFGDSDKLQLGQSVIAIGNALAEFRNTVSVGIVSGLARSITAGDNSGKFETLDHVIQTDAAINPGNSGGPLLDLNGNVIGVNVAIAQGSQNIGFALPVNSVKSAIESVEKTGKIIRPYLGVRYTTITPEMKEKNNLEVDYGVIVKGGGEDELAVIPGSPADKAGIVENDIILEIDGVKLDDKNSLASIIRGKSIGQTIMLKILHKGQEKTVQVTLEQAKDN